MLARRLKKWDTIWITAPSNPLSVKDKQYLDNFIIKMNEYWLAVVVCKSIYTNIWHESRYTDYKERTDDLNKMFLNDSIDAIWFLQWGDTANGMLNYIDYDLIIKNPKILLWKSDIDVLLLAINSMTWLVSFHWCDAKLWDNKEFWLEYTQKWFNKRLLHWNKTFVASWEEWSTIVPWMCEGRILGCNITSLLELAGTIYFPDFTNAILFIETYKTLDSLLIMKLNHLEQLWVFTKINGIVIGSNFWYESNKFTPEWIIKSFAEKYSLPTLKTNEFWHYQPHAFIPIWSKIKLNSTNKTIEIIEDFIK